MSVSRTVLRRVGDRLAAHAGLHPPTWVLEARVKQRMSAVSMSTADSYADLVERPGGLPELQELIESLRVGETRFFRHQAHVDALCKTVIPELADRRMGKKIRAWSAGCATGEEAYTLAILLSRSLPAPTYRLNVLASDISHEAIQTARKRVFGDYAVSLMPENIRRWSFESLASGQYQVHPHIADLVEFEQQNLADARYPASMDLIWCRNVLIYFTAEARQQAVRRLIASLRPGGYLFVGYSESLRDFDDLEAIETSASVIYQKPMAGEAIAMAKTAPKPAPLARAKTQPSPPATPPATPTPTPSTRTKTTSTRTPPQETTIILQGRYDETERLSRELAVMLSGTHARINIELDGAEYLDDDASAVLRRACSAARAAGVRVVLKAERQSTRRWLTRARIDEGQS